MDKFGLDPTKAHYDEENFFLPQESWLITRREFIKWAFTAGIAAAIGGIISRFFVAPPTPPPKPPILLGHISGKTGIAASWGLHELLGATLAVEDLNERGGVLGRPVRIISEDDKLSGEIAVKLVDKLWLEDKVAAIMGTVSSGVHKAMIKRTKELKALHLGTSSCGDYFRTIYFHDLYFQFQPDSRSTYRSTIPFFFKEYDPDPDKLLMTIQDYAMGWSHERVVRALMKNMFGKELKHVIKWPIGTRDFTPWFPKIKALDPEWYIPSTWGMDSVTQFTQMMNVIPDVLSKLKGVAAGCCTILESDLPSYWSMIAGKWTFSLTLPKTWYETPWSCVASQVPAYKEFADKYIRRFGIPPTQVSGINYAAVMAWAEAVEKAGSLRPEDVAAALEGMRTKSILGSGEIWIRPEDHVCVQDLFLCKYVPKPGLKASVVALYRVKGEWCMGKPFAGEKILPGESDEKALARIYEDEMYKPFPTYERLEGWESPVY